MRARGESPFVVDVRRPDENAVGHLDGVLIPLQELPQRLDELASHRDEQIVVHCRSGARSAQAVEYLRAEGYDAVNLKGGLIAWRDEIDATVEVK